MRSSSRKHICYAVFSSLLLQVIAEFTSGQEYNHPCLVARHLKVNMRAVGGTTSNATVSTGFCVDEDRPNSPKAFYTFVGDGGRLAVSTCDSRTDFPTAIAIREEDCFAGKCVVVGNVKNEECKNNRHAASYTFESEKGKTYIVAVYGEENGSVGDYGVKVINVTPNPTFSQASSVTYPATWLMITFLVGCHVFM